jgi:membrane protease subunit (stomatin/prohibitin family)
VVSGAYTEEIEAAVLEDVKRYVDHYGVRIVQLGNFVLSIKDEDERNLKKLYTDAAYVRMAGGMQGYQQFASGKAMMGAGEGMAKGGGGGGGGNGMLGGAALGVGFGMANMFQQNANQQAGAPQAPPTHSGGQLEGNPQTEPQSAPASVTCPECNSTVSPGKFCAECGKPLPTGPKFCNKCGHKLEPMAKFCPDCGNKIG